MLGARTAEKVVSWAVRPLGRGLAAGCPLRGGAGAAAGWLRRLGWRGAPSREAAGGPGLPVPGWEEVGVRSPLSLRRALTGEEERESVRSPWLWRGVVGAEGYLVGPAPW